MSRAWMGGVAVSALFLGVAGMCFLSALTWFWIDCTRRVVED